MVRPSLLTKSFNIAPDELESARYCSREQGISLNKYLRLAVLEKNRGVVQGLEASDTLSAIQTTVRESEARAFLAMESLLADVRAEVSATISANEDLEKLVVKTLQAFMKTLAQEEPDTQAPAKQSASKPARNPSSAFLPPKP